MIVADERAQLARKAQDQLAADRVADRRRAVRARVDRIGDVAVIREHAVIAKLELFVELQLAQPERGRDAPLRGRRRREQAIVIAEDVVKHGSPLASLSRNASKNGCSRRMVSSTILSTF